MNTPILARLSTNRVADSGVVLAIGAALISGLAIYLNAFAVKQVPDAAVYTTLKNGVAAVLLVVALTAIGGTRSISTIDRRQWPAILFVGVVGGSIPFILFFTGLAQASAPSAAFIQKTLFVWVAVLAAPLLGERLGIASVAAIAALFAGQALVLPPTNVRWGAGEWLILAATLMWAVETVLVKRLLASVPAATMATLRMAVGFVILVGYVAVSGRLGQVAALGAAQWLWIIVAGGVLAGYVATWFAALERAPASIVTSVLVLGAVLTGVLTSLAGGKAPAPAVVGGYALIVVAVATIAAVPARRRAQAPVLETVVA